jgi:predicted RNase H-like HicB family nuclease
MQFKLLFKKQSEWGYLCYVPSLPGCVVQWDTIDEARDMALDVIPSCISIFEEEWIEITDDTYTIESQITIPFIGKSLSHQYA